MSNDTKLQQNIFMANSLLQWRNLMMSTALRLNTSFNFICYDILFLCLLHQWRLECATACQELEVSFTLCNKIVVIIITCIQDWFKPLMMDVKQSKTGHDLLQHVYSVGIDYLGDSNGDSDIVNNATLDLIDIRRNTNGEYECFFFMIR